MPLRRLLAVLASVAAVLLWAIPGAAAQETSTSTSTTTSTTTTSTTTPTPTPTAPAPTTTEPVPSPLPSCQEVLAFDRDGSVSGDDPTRIRLAPPSGRRVTIDLHYTGGAGGVDVRNCVSFTSSSGGREVVTQDTTSLCCVSFDRRFSVLLPRQPTPGTEVCAQEAIREAFSDGLEVSFTVTFTNRVCRVVPGGSRVGPQEGELPFTGPAHLLPLAPLAAVAIALGATALLVARARPQ
jgi:hypothetical protein